MHKRMETKSEFSRKFSSVQFLPLSSGRKNAANKTYHTYCVRLEYIDNVDQISSSDCYRLQALLFDEKYKKFVGSCWNGNHVSMKNKKISFNQNFYFYSSVPGKELILVVGVIAVSESKEDSMIGWLCLPLIEADESSSTLDHSVGYKVPVLHGTPYTLLILNEGMKEIKLAEYTTGMEISLSLMPYPLLLQVAHLVPENVLIDAADSIPGLITEQGSAISSVGYVYKPHLQKCVTFVLGSLCIRIHPSIEVAEKNILDKVSQEYEAVGSVDDNAIKAHVVQRRLQVGVHNGYCFIQDQDFYHLLVEPIVTPKAQKTHQRSSSMGSINYSRESGLTLRSDIKLPNVPDDPNIAFIFLIEYTISLSGSLNTSNSTSSISKSPTSSIAIVWGYVKLANLRVNPSQTVPLSCDPTSSPHKILFLKTPHKFELSFTTSVLSKQNKNSSAVQSVEDYSSVASFSTKTYISPETSYMHSPANSVPVPKHKSVGDIPMTVNQYNVGCPKSGNTNHAFKDVENNMNLQEVTLVSSSLPLVPPMLHSFPLNCGSTFRTFTKLYWDKLQPVLDHRGKPATILDSSLPYHIDKKVELSCPPQRNECMIQLLAISCIEEYVQIPSEMFFTFQFYRFLPVRTESLLLKALSENDESVPASSLVYALFTFRDREKIPGFQVTYSVDPSELVDGEYKPFLQYLMKQTLHIDLWNGQSLLYFGTALLPLKYFCRQGKDATSVLLELDIINCEFADESLSQMTLTPESRKGKLHVRLASVRHPLTAKALEKLEDVNTESVIIFPKSEKNNSIHSVPTVSKARPIVETNRELSNLLASRCTMHCSQKSQDSYISEERRRKLARMEAVRNLENEIKNVHIIDEGMKYFLKEREQDLLTIQSYIERNKTEMIQSMLHASITYEKIIYPVIGNRAFFEFVLENPFQEPKIVGISWKCSELSLVTDAKLWQMLRNAHNIPQKVNSITFGDVGSDVPSVHLQPKEKIHIPFTYCSLSAPSSQLEIFKTASGHHFGSDILSSAPVSSNLIESNVKIRFVTEDQILLAVLIVKVQPLPPSFSHIFKFLSREHSMFKKIIRINSDYIKNHKVSVRCSDPDVVCSVQEPQDWEDDITIHVKASTKAAGKLKEFYLFLYKDAHQVTAFQIWIITICPLQRIDLSCIAGQLMRSSLLIRGTRATNLVRCFSSSSDLQLHPSESFLLSPFAVQELSMNVRSLLPGMKHFQITMVNQSLELVTQSWLLVLSCQKPSVSKAFQVHLSIGKEATKRITYSNPYNQDRNFVLHSSHPHLLRLRESKFTVPMGKSYCIGLYFLPQDHIFTETLFLYLNDMNDKNEETYCVKVICQ